MCKDNRLWQTFKKLNGEEITIKTHLSIWGRIIQEEEIKDYRIFVFERPFANKHFDYPVVVTFRRRAVDGSTESTLELAKWRVKHIIEEPYQFICHLHDRKRWKKTKN